MTALYTLVQAAIEARKSAYAPYSGFPVGAAVLTPCGEVFTGCNVENVASPEGMCAEAAAISAMVRGGHQAIAAVAVVGGNAEKICFPCGGCRQKIQEFASAATEIVIATPEGAEMRRCRLSDLFPDPFMP